jgi:hypothetical protein
MRRWGGVGFEREKSEERERWSKATMFHLDRRNKN